MNENQKTAKIAGILFLILAVTAAVDQSFMHSLYARDGALTTVQNIQASGWLYRLNLASNILGEIAFLLTAFFLYKLFKGVSKDWAGIMALLVYASVPVAILNMLSQFAPVFLLNSAYTEAWGVVQQNNLVMLFLDLYFHGVYIAGIFWGLWLLPLGYLVFKSGYMHKAVSILLIIAGLGYFARNLLSILAPDIDTSVLSYTFIGEVVFLFWLLFAKLRSRETEK